MPSHPTPFTNAHANRINAHSAIARLWLLAALLIGFALRLHRLGGESLWYDETVSAYLAAQPIVDLIAHTARDIHPPGYYLLLHAWQSISTPTVAFGLEFLYAWPSLIFDIIIVVMTYAITKRIFGETAANWALGLASIHPTQIWFAQEVRMYSLGAFCLMLTLWAVTPLLRPHTQQAAHTAIPRITRILYPLASIIGLYTLYYFLLWLLPLNIVILLQVKQNWRSLRTWLILQFVVLVGWSPWLPIFARQTLTPPVPAWRVPWQNVGDILQATGEALAALWVSHLPPLGIHWPWALIALLVSIVFFGYTKTVSTKWQWLTLTFAPALLLIAISIVGPPIFHVRYVSTYAPVFIILLATSLARMRPIHSVILLAILVTTSALSLQQLWYSPQNAADDHRTAVATLAQNWRPGDAILVNAGWAYTTLSVYWPTELPSPTASRPPDITKIVRLEPSAITPETTNESQPTVYRTGSINGAPTLGWGLPESDFFAIAPSSTHDALKGLAQIHPRIWHYRIYDTVSDPDGLIRQWLDAHADKVYTQQITGRDYLLLEAYATSAAAPTLLTTNLYFPDLAVSMVNSSLPSSLPAGETLYVSVDWRAAPEYVPDNAALSLRLLDATGHIIAQQDSPLAATTTSAQSQQVLALPIPAATIPGQYQVGLIVYSPSTLAPFTAVGEDGKPITVPLSLGELSVKLSLIPPHTNPPSAIFYYIELLQTDWPATSIAPGTSLETTWTWRPRANSYRDHYRAEVQLTGSSPHPIHLASFDLGGTTYPSSAWAANYSVKQRELLTVPADAAPGTYTVQLRLVRASDGQEIQARQPWQPWTVPSVAVGELEIVVGE